MTVVNITPPSWILPDTGTGPCGGTPRSYRYTWRVVTQLGEHPDVVERGVGTSRDSAMQRAEEVLYRWRSGLAEVKAIPMGVPLGADEPERVVAMGRLDPETGEPLWSFDLTPRGGKPGSYWYQYLILSGGAVVENRVSDDNEKALDGIETLLRERPTLIVVMWTMPMNIPVYENYDHTVAIGVWDEATRQIVWELDDGSNKDRYVEIAVVPEDPA